MFDSCGEFVEISHQPVYRMFVYIIRQPLTDSHFALSVQVSWKYLERRLYMDYIYPAKYVICSAVRFAKISSPNECDKIRKIAERSSRS